MGLLRGGRREPLSRTCDRHRNPRLPSSSAGRPLRWRLRPIHGLPVKVEPVDLAGIALKRLGLVGKGHQRDGRPTQDELDRLIGHFYANPRQIAPVSQIIRFAVATAMRQEEICKMRWSDLESRTRMLLICDRKGKAQQ
ncbi:integrase family protein (plasmid) [Mesorhizobium loti]|uniref:tyrosine-type recombinase/integrase n=1 Tax=Mesorhizobium sp. 131-2-5 TaxID=2744519 RepID=UPI0008199AAA|nr:integrase family protein [Mesorhizobium loti]BCH04948.1 hypothetical protein MesoLj131b_69470 [Mesorhizobium sp. 131-2-5]